jgi:hypothetical protein
MIPLLFLGISAKSQVNEYTQLVGYATKAPSGHNTQPWIFKLTDSTIEIHPNFCMALPVVDKNHRELYISLGCAAENLIIAANEFGYEADFSIIENQGKHTFISIKLQKDQTIKNYLFDQIDKRQTNRSEYTSDTIPEFTIRKIDNLLSKQNLGIHFYKRGSEEFNLLKNLVAEGNSIQMMDEAFKNELLEWIRFNKKQANKYKNGLTNSVMGTPSTPSFIGKPIVKSFLKPEKQNKSDMKKINSSSHLVLFTVEQNNPVGWIQVGRVLERFLLETTRFGIANAYLNQPCEVESVREKVQSELPINGNHPMLLLRIGYAEPLPYSPRKNVYDVIE